MSHSIDALADARARTVDNSHAHPLNPQLVQTLTDLGWVHDAEVRVRDQGHVFHVEAFIVPAPTPVDLDRLDQVREALLDLDWKIHDVVVVPVAEIPHHQVPHTRTDPARSQRDRLSGERA